MPQPTSLGSAYSGTFDAWKRLTKLVDATTNETVQVSQYDGRNYRRGRATYESSRSFRDAGTSSSRGGGRYWKSGSPARSPIGSTSGACGRGMTMVLRHQFIDGTPSQRLYALQDANWNVVAVCNISWRGSGAR